MLKNALSLIVVFAAAALGQPEASSITVTASRSAALQPDQVLFAVSVQSDLNTGLNDVLAALQGSGITIANFADVNSSDPGLIFQPNPPVQPTIQWTFLLSTPLTKTTDTVAALTTLQQNIAQNNKPLQLSFSIRGSQISTQLQQSQTCSLADLITDARTQAQNLASAGAVSLGSILAISSPGPVEFSALSAVSFPGGLLSPAPTLQAPCAVTVTFALIRLQ